jgi:hemin uptake protein HemP
MMNESASQDHSAPAPHIELGPANPIQARTVNSTDLLQGAAELLIQHDDQTYRLRLTRNGKLILVK